MRKTVLFILILTVGMIACKKEEIRPTNTELLRYTVMVCNKYDSDYGLWLMNYPKSNNNPKFLTHLGNTWIDTFRCSVSQPRDIPVCAYARTFNQVDVTVIKLYLEGKLVRADSTNGYATKAFIYYDPIAYEHLP